MTILFVLVCTTSHLTRKRDPIAVKALYSLKLLKYNTIERLLSEVTFNHLYQSQDINNLLCQIETAIKMITFLFYFIFSTHHNVVYFMYVRTLIHKEGKTCGYVWAIK